MKKKISCLIAIFALIVFALYAGNVEADAAEKVVYETFLSQITKFKQSNGRLIIKTKSKWRDEIEINDAVKYIKGVKKKSLNLKISSNCKWSQSSIGAKSYAKYSYDALKNDIKDSQSEGGEFEGLVQIFVKDKKVVRVNLMTS